jgi:hypothetical protein
MQVQICDAAGCDGLISDFASRCHRNELGIRRG